RDRRGFDARRERRGVREYAARRRSDAAGDHRPRGWKLGAGRGPASRIGGPERYGRGTPRQAEGGAGPCGHRGHEARLAVLEQLRASFRGDDPFAVRDRRLAGDRAAAASRHEHPLGDGPTEGRWLGQRELRTPVDLAEQRNERSAAPARGQRVLADGHAVDAGPAGLADRALAGRAWLRRWRGDLLCERPDARTDGPALVPVVPEQLAAIQLSVHGHLRPEG